jgi:succinoglycan biosynthesis transport protein ExoP
MDASSPLALPPRELVRLVWSQRKLWVATTFVCAALAAAYSLAMPRYWDAYQGLVVRQETAGSTASRPGKFADLYEMRTMQETILEIAKSQQVVVATLEAVNRAEGLAAEPPSLEDIEEFRKRLKMLPPDGGEFGKTEVFYFCVKAEGRDHAIRLVDELSRQLEIALRTLRADRAGSLIVELEEQAKLANELLEAETKKLSEFESRVGADLGELRMLHSANSGQSDLRMEGVQLDADVRKFRTQVREGEKLIALLKAAQEDPQQLIATPNSLLTSQPALRRLKDGLIDAQIATSKLGGTRSADHPRVRAALEAEQQIRSDLHGELVTAIRGAEVELQLSRDSLAAAQERIDNLDGRFADLAELRAEYSNRVATVENCRLTLDRARQNLGTARAAQAAAHSGSLVTRLEKSPETGPHPAGLGRTVITGAGAVAGLLLGLGLVFLLAESTGRDQATAVAQIAKSSDVVAPAPMPPQSAVTQFAMRDTTDMRGVPPITVEIPAAPVAPREVVVVAPESAPTTRETSPPTPKQAPRKRETKPVPAAPVVLPVAVGKLPSHGSNGGYGGLSLQEALQAAARQMSN